MANYKSVLNVNMHSQADIEKLTEKLKTTQSGLNNNDVEALLPNLSIQERLIVINALIAKGCINLYDTKDGVIYKWKSENPQNLRGAENEEMVVYQIIKESGNKGIWIRDIRLKSNLNVIQLNKVLKSLEGKRSIKAVKSVSAGKKKVYMLYDLEPDSSLTGGAWYNDQDFESEFVDVLSRQSYHFLLMKKEKADGLSAYDLEAVKSASFASAEEVLKYITGLGISKIQLSESDIVTILDLLVYDDRAEKIESKNGRIFYRTLPPLISAPGPSRTPCGICNIQKNCCVGADVCPDTCTYLTDWLS